MFSVEKKSISAKRNTRHYIKRTGSYTCSITRVSPNKLLISHFLQPETSDTDCSPFENNAWQKLRSDLVAQSSELLKLVEENVVDKVKRMNIIKHTSRKIPLFAAVIFHLDPSVSDPSVVLKDPSGKFCKNSLPMYNRSFIFEICSRNQCGINPMNRWVECPEEQIWEKRKKCIF